MAFIDLIGHKERSRTLLDELNVVPPGKDGVASRETRPSFADCNILYPVVFSERCVLAADQVRMWTERLGANLLTLHVVDTDQFPGTSGIMKDNRVYNELQLTMARRAADLKYFCNRYFGRNIARPTVLVGSREPEIESFSKREKIDLIMLPRNHQHLLSRFLHDSLTATILERCTASVWTTEYLDDACPPSINKILCAVHFARDMTLEAQNHRILRAVWELATRFQAKVTFLRVIDGNEKQDEVPPRLRAISGAEPWLALARELFGHAAAFLTMKGNVVTTISNTADQVAADLIVVGRTRPGTIGLGVQGNILKINYVARRPVLSVW